LRLCLGRIVGGGKGDEKGKGSEVREPKRHGSLAIATSEQAEGWDVTRKVSFSFFSLSFCFLFRFISQSFLLAHSSVLYITYVHERSCAFCGLLLAHLFSFWGEPGLRTSLAEVLAYMHLCP
jgi:hypothetical protein